jgi:SAM-dependent methyltransferase
MELARRAYRWLEAPPRLVAVRRGLGREPRSVLDVGCGNHSPTVTKRHFPGCQYHGVDRRSWNVDDRDRAAMDRYFDLDLQQPDELGTIEDGWYEAVLLSHVLEHLDDPYRVVTEVASKVAPGGVLYVETPSPRSMTLPPARARRLGFRGCLNFHDDPTHRTLVDLPRVRGLLAARGFEVGPVQPRWSWRRVLLLPAYAAAGLASRGYVPASVVWEVTRFAHWILARRPREVGRRHPACERVRGTDFQSVPS